jgi:hypothetical protein
MTATLVLLAMCYVGGVADGNCLPMAHHLTLAQCQDTAALGNHNLAIGGALTGQRYVCLTRKIEIPEWRVE